MDSKECSLFNFNEKSVRIVGTSDQPWFVAKDVGEILDIKNIRDSISTLPDDEKGVNLILTRAGPQKMIIINKKGLCRVLTKTRNASPDIVKALCERFDIPCKLYKHLSIEADTISSILKALPSSVKAFKQFSVYKYRIDLYLPDYKLAIECDEYGHQSYDRIKDMARTEFITKQLQCRWIRYNPYDKRFNIFVVIRSIYEKIIHP